MSRGLPSSHAAKVTETVGWFETGIDALGPWLTSALGDVSIRPAKASSLADVVALLGDTRRLTTRALVPARRWVAMLTDGPNGTDVAMLPSLAARTLGCRAIRATAAQERPGTFGATILEVYDPAATDDVLRLRRAIAAIDDGGRWRFEERGEPFEFEPPDRFTARRVRDRFTPAALDEYLAALGVDDLDDLDVERTMIVR